MSNERLDELISFWETYGDEWLREIKSTMLEKGLCIIGKEEGR